MIPESLLAELTEEQRLAVIHKDGPVMVLAGAGSGKTRVITRRIAALVARGIPEENILAVTFTNKAAAEMKQRVDSLLGQNTRVWLSTFHSLCARLLRLEAHRIDFPQNFGICGEDDVIQIIKDSMEELNIDTTNLKPSFVRNVIDKRKTEMVSPEEFAAEAQTPYHKTLAGIYTVYQKHLKESALMDFGDLIYFTVKLLENDSEVSEKYQTRFRYILIDEYQDTNHTQYRLTRALTKQYRNLCVVGDPDQSIYGWRGADIRNLINFKEDYPDAKVIGLDTNFRSTEIILNAANNIIKLNPPPHQQLKTPPSTEPVEASKIYIANLPTPEEEADKIAQIIEDHVNQGTNYGEIGVLYRVNQQAKLLERALLLRQIPYVVLDGTAFYEYKEVKTLLAYMRVLVNPKDDISFWKVINYPARGIGKEAQSALAKYRRARGGTLIEALLDRKLSENIQPSHSKKFDEIIPVFNNLIEIMSQPANTVYKTIVEATEIKKALNKEYRPKFARLFKKKTQSVPGYTEEGADEFVEHIASQIGDWNEEELGNHLGSALSAITGRREIVQIVRRWWTALNNVDTLGDIISDYDDRQPQGGMLGFLESAALVSDMDKRLPDENCVRLLTLHSAKGLEFPEVIIAGAEKGLFPSTQSFADEVSNELQREEEERRLFYVGITRAMRRLSLTYCWDRLMFGRHTGGKSPFIEHLINELPMSHVEMEDERPPLMQNFAYERYSNYPSHPLPKPRPTKTEPADKSIPFKVGDSVRHRTFGIGIVSDISGSEARCKVKVRFKRVGEKSLLLEFAPLEKI